MMQAAMLEGQSTNSFETKPVDSGHAAAEFAGFCLALVQYFLTMPIIPSFWNGNAYSVPLYVGSM